MTKRTQTPPSVREQTSSSPDEIEKAIFLSKVFSCQPLQEGAVVSPSQDGRGVGVVARGGTGGDQPQVWSDFGHTDKLAGGVS